MSTMHIHSTTKPFSTEVQCVRAARFAGGEPVAEVGLDRPSAGRVGGRRGAVGDEREARERPPREPASLPADVSVVFFESALWSASGARGIAAEVARLVRASAGRRVVVVASAEQSALESAAARVARLHAMSDEAERAALLSVPEIEAAGRLSIELARLGIAASVADPHAVGPITRGAALDAEPRRLNVPELARALHRTPVVILPGAMGRDEAGTLTHLGWDGAELLAAFVADRLALRLRVVRAAGLPASPMVELDHAVELSWGSGRLVSRKTALYARKRGLWIDIATPGDDRTSSLGSWGGGSVPRASLGQRVPLGSDGPQPAPLAAGVGRAEAVTAA